MRVISVMPGHGNKPTGWDPGAVSPAGWAEAELVRDVAVLVLRQLQREHVPAELLAAGSYAERGQDAAAGAGSVLVVQLHADAAAAEVGPDESRVFFWPENPDGQAVAEAVAVSLRGVMPWIVRVESADQRWPNARACLAAVPTTSILIELGFTDGPRGRTFLPQRTGTIGLALTQGLLQWWRAMA